MGKAFTIDLSERGANGGKKAAENMTPAQRRKRAKKAVAERWRRYYEANPDKRPAE